MFSQTEMLQFAIENGILDESTIQEKMIMNERKKYLEKHPYKIWQGKDEKWYTYLPDADSGRKMKRLSTKKAIEDSIVDYYKELEVNPTIEMVFEEWINQKLEYNEIKKQTYDKYQTEFDRFFTNNPYVKNFGKRKVKHVTEDDLENFIKTTIAKMELTQKAYSGMRILINGIFKKARKLTDISISSFMKDLDISQRAFKKRIVRKENEVYQEGEAELLTDYLKSQKDDIRCQALLLIFQAGLRVGELCGLKESDIGEKYIHVQRTEIKYKDVDGNWKIDVQEFPKSEAGDRYIIISESAMETINNVLRIRSNGEFLFSENGKRVRSNGMRRKLMRCCEKAGVQYKSNHKIRKTYGTMLIDGGVDDSIVAEQMGHTDISTTRKYYYFSNKSEEKKREQIIRAMNY